MYQVNILSELIILNYLSRAKKFKAKKRLGQNFLIDSGVIEKIIQTADINHDETVIEIGPGLGFVTEKLAEFANKVIAVEIDEDAINELNKLPFNNIEILNQDILKTELSKIVKEPVKIIANIPYYITSPILAHLLGEIDLENCSDRQYIKEIILIVQWEVAKRLTADEKSKNKEYGLLSILSNYWTEPELICKVPANSFFPIPKVDSALLKLKIRKEPALKLDNPKLFRRITQASFNTRRKTIKNSLIMAGFKQNAIINALKNSNINPERRGETLSMKEFKELSDFMQKELNNADD